MAASDNPRTEEDMLQAAANKRSIERVTWNPPGPTYNVESPKYIYNPCVPLITTSPRDNSR